MLATVGHKLVDLGLGFLINVPVLLFGKPVQPVCIIRIRDKPYDLAEFFFVGCALDLPLGPSEERLADEDIEREEMVVQLGAALADLEERDRLVLTLYYYEELKLHQIADVLGVTESRVSQIRSAALVQLRGQLVE